jgi:hypothetical protein
MLWDYFGNKIPPLVGIMTLFRPHLFVASPELLEEIYVTKNKYFDKEPGLAMVMGPLLGNSTLVQVSNEEWSQKRKSVS